MICVSGTPGVGKSALLKEMMERGFAVKEFDEVSQGCSAGSKNGERIVDENCLRSLRFDGIFFGHLSHFAKCDLVIIIRSHLKDIQSRLKERGYPAEKIMDNVESESIDIIGVEAEENHPGKTFEILNENLLETADLLEKIIKRNFFPSKKIHLTEEILDWY